MKKVLLFGGTGNLGKEIARELTLKGYETSAVVRKSSMGKLEGLVDHLIEADVTEDASLKGICKDFDIVVSSLGKSVSIKDRSSQNFTAIDFEANYSILKESIRSGIKKFIYVSAFHSEKHKHLEYFKVHHDFSKVLINSGLDYSIVKPPAIFSAFLDLLELAKKGRLINIGKGDKRTNPIYEGDLAKICVDAIHVRNSIIEAGGKQIYTRKQLNEIIQKAVNPNKPLRTMPSAVMNLMLPIARVVDKNAYDKFAFFAEVMKHDTIAPQVGEMRFEDYVALKVRQIENNAVLQEEK
jgi:uncharacterized protein YbjT (DUF2867 family)